MKLIHYIKKCCEDPEFKKYWDEDNLNDQKGLSISEALELLSEFDYSDLIKNKRISKSDIYVNDVILLELPNGKCPTIEFLDKIQNGKLKEKTVRSIYLLAEEGRSARPPLSKYVQDGIFELRTNQSNNITRIFYFFVYGEQIILTNGYIKKQEKMDKREFEKAKKYMNDYLSSK